MTFAELVEQERAAFARRAERDAVEAEAILRQHGYPTPEEIEAARERARAGVWAAWPHALRQLHAWRLENYAAQDFTQPPPPPSLQ